MEQIAGFVKSAQRQLDVLLQRGDMVLAERIELSGVAAFEAEEFVQRTHRDSKHELLVNWSTEAVAEIFLEAMLAAALGVKARARAVGSIDACLETAKFDWRSALPESPSELSTDGTVDAVFVDDAGHPADIVLAIKCESERIQKDTSADSGLLRQACGALGSDVSGWVRKTAFAAHVVRRTLSKRSAPIYWQLATPSASYSVWCYYHRLTHDTFFRVANDYVTPKVDHEERKLNALRQEAGPEPTSKQRRGVDAQETFVAALRAFKTEVTRIAPLWNPNLNDSVIINFAPLWRLVPQHKPWQKECKRVWDKLVKGDYDWAQLAMHLWPERVVPKCKDDRSLAVAHGLEADFWCEDDKGKWQQRQVSGDRVEELVAERASTAVKAALKDLLEAPAPAGKTRRKRRVSA